MPLKTDEERTKDEELLSQIFAMVQETKKKPKKKINISDEERDIRLERLKRGRVTATANRLAKRKAKEKEPKCVGCVRRNRENLDTRVW